MENQNTCFKCNELLNNTFTYELNCKHKYCLICVYHKKNDDNEYICKCNYKTYIANSPVYKCENNNINDTIAKLYKINVNTINVNTMITVETNIDDIMDALVISFNSKICIKHFVNVDTNKNVENYYFGKSVDCCTLSDNKLKIYLDECYYVDCSSWNFYWSSSFKEN